MSTPIATWRHPDFGNLYEAHQHSCGLFMIGGRRCRIVGKSDPFSNGGLGGPTWNVTGETTMDEHAIAALQATKAA